MFMSNHAHIHVLIFIPMFVVCCRQQGLIDGVAWARVDGRPRIQARTGMQMQAMNVGNGSQSTAGTNGKSSPMTVQISEDQMSSLSSYLKDFKTETTNQIAVNVPVGAVQVTVRENAIDYDGLARQVGQRVVSEVRRAMENRKTIMA